jgi:hypothetical protein
MTVCADQLALLDLGKDQTAAAMSAEEGAQVSDLRRPWQMIPRHGGVMEHPSAVGAGTPGL